MADVAHVAPAATPNGGAGDAAALMPTKRKNKPPAPNAPMPHKYEQVVTTSEDGTNTVSYNKLQMQPGLLFRKRAQPHVRTPLAQKPPEKPELYPPHVSILKNGDVDAALYPNQLLMQYAIQVVRRDLNDCRDVAGDYDVETYPAEPSQGDKVIIRCSMNFLRGLGVDVAEGSFESADSFYRIAPGVNLNTQTDKHFDSGNFKNFVKHVGRFLSLREGDSKSDYGPNQEVVEAAAEAFIKLLNFKSDAEEVVDVEGGAAEPEDHEAPVPGSNITEPIAALVVVLKAQNPKFVFPSDIAKVKYEHLKLVAAATKNLLKKNDGKRKVQWLRSVHSIMDVSSLSVLLRLLL
jgi:hypothetical protein